MQDVKKIYGKKRGRIIMFTYFNDNFKNDNLVYQVLISLPNHEGSFEDIYAVDPTFKIKKVKSALNRLVDRKLVSIKLVNNTKIIYTMV